LWTLLAALSALVMMILLPCPPAPCPVPCGATFLPVLAVGGGWPLGFTCFQVGSRVARRCPLHTTGAWWSWSLGYHVYQFRLMSVPGPTRTPATLLQRDS